MTYWIEYMVHVSQKTKSLITILSRILAAFAVHVSAGAAEISPTLEAIRSRDRLHCGVIGGVPGFAVPNRQGIFEGHDVDFCHAVAAAVLKDSNKVRISNYTFQQRFISVQSGEEDLLGGNTTATYKRDTEIGLTYPGITYFDTQGMLVHHGASVKFNLKSINELRELLPTVCVPIGTTTQKILAEWSRTEKIAIKSLAVEGYDKLLESFYAERCDAYTEHTSALIGARETFLKGKKFYLFPEYMSKQPAGPFVRTDDRKWNEIIRWIIYVLIEAEVRGVTMKNVDIMKTSRVPEIHNLLSGPIGETLGLDREFAYRVIKAVGNYGEMFERHLGMKSALKIERGLNDLWTRGGLMFSPPFPSDTKQVSEFTPKPK